MCTDTAHLCKCNKCNSILIDENPQVKAKERETTGEEKKMVWIDDEGGFWACPICLTDGYLVDL